MRKLDVDRCIDYALMGGFAILFLAASIATSIWMWVILIRWVTNVQC